MSNTIAALWASIVRTFTPIIVGFVGGWFITAGITVDDRFESLLTLAISGVLTGVYYVAVRLLEIYVAPKFGWLLGLAKTPTQYTPGSSTSVMTPADPNQPSAGVPPAL
jgi:hypothetical protein